ncbi:MAG: ABC transporter substrate-binding protein [Novosphingobium sp.]
MRFALLLPILVLAGCARVRDDAVTVLMLDTDRDGAEAIRGATAEGLVGFDAEGRIVPALADRWIVTDDGESYIFRLRDGTWADGTPLTGETARLALRQALAAARGTALAADLAVVDDVRAMAGRVVEVRLTRPHPDFLQLLGQPELGLVHRGRGAGPMALRRDGAAAVLTPIAPERRGLPAVKDWAGQIRPLRLFGATARAAIQRFDDDRAIVVLGGTFADWPELAEARLPAATVRIDPVAGLFGLAVEHSDGFLAEAENREAVAMAIDRDALATAFGAPGWIPTTRLVSPGADGEMGLVAERWAGQTIAARQAIAASRVTRWRTDHGEVTLRIALPHGLGGDVLFARLALDLAAAGFKAVRRGPGEAADLRLLDRTAVYARADWFFAQLGCTARPRACSATADASYAAARGLAEPAARAKGLAEAEAQLMAANLFIPLGTPLRWSLAAPDTAGFAVNPTGRHALLPLAMRAAR